jgi:hypothetical protein
MAFPCPACQQPLSCKLHEDCVAFYFAEMAADCWHDTLCVSCGEVLNVSRFDGVLAVRAMTASEFLSMPHAAQKTLLRRRATVLGEEIETRGGGAARVPVRRATRYPRRPRRR